MLPDGCIAEIAAILLNPGLSAKQGLHTSTPSQPAIMYDSSCGHAEVNA